MGGSVWTRAQPDERVEERIGRGVRGEKRGE